MLRKIIFFVLVALLINCSEDKEPGPRPFARLSTLAVAEINSEGALLTGEITMANESVIDHGFLLSRFAQFPSTGSAKFSLGAKNSIGQFQVRAETELEEGVKYFVKAFAKTADFTSFGLPVEFVSLGSKAPQIATLSPTEGLWNGVVVLKGKNFSYIKGNNVVKFDGLASNVISSSTDSIVCQIPAALNVSPATVQVSVSGNSSQLTNAFSLLPPQIDKVEPAQGNVGESITITGKNFNSSTTRVTLGDVQVTLTQSISTSLIFKVPPGLAAGPIKIKVVTAAGNGVAEAEFIALTPKVTNVYPLTGTYNDFITVEVENWLPNEQVALLFGPYAQYPVDQTGNTFTFRVPVSMESYQYDLKVQLGQSVIPTGKTFTLDPPEIYSVEPEVVLSPQITIFGKNFSEYHNDVQIDGISAHIYYNNHEAIQIALPETESHLASVTLTSSGRTVEAPAKIKIPFVKLSGISPSSYIYHKMFAIGDQLYLTAEYQWNSYLYRFDRYALRWHVVEHLPFMTGPDDFVFEINQSAYYFSSSSKAFWAYSPETGLTQKSDAPFEVTRPATFSVDGNGYVIGGLDTDLNQTDAVWRYDPANDVWSQQSSASGALLERVGFVKDNICYAFLTDGRLAAYNPQNDTWTNTSFIFDVSPGFVGYNNGSLYFRSYSPELIRFSFDTGLYSSFEDQGLLDNVLSDVSYQTNSYVYFLNYNGQLWEFDGNYL